MTGTVLITGGSTRIGRFIAEGLVKDGWKVVIHYNRSESAAQALADDLNTNGKRAAIISGNLNVPGDVQSLIDRAANRIDAPLSALINNASSFDADDIRDTSGALFDHHMDVNLRAPLLLSQAFAAQLPDGTPGSIINMIDQRVLKPNPQFLTYSLSKAGLHWLTKTLAQALAPHIRVNAVGPGPTLRNHMQSEVEFERELQSTLLRNGSPPDAILDAIRYLLGASSVTGQMIAVDGGQHLLWQTADLKTED